MDFNGSNPQLALSPFEMPGNSHYIVQNDGTVQQFNIDV